MARAHRSNRLIDRAAEPSPTLVVDRISAVGSLCTTDQVAPSFRVRCAPWNSSPSERFARRGGAAVERMEPDLLVS
jgi:hypothetical protein